MNIFSSIRAQAKLPMGWHNGKGSPSIPLAIDAALQLCARLIKRGYSALDMEDFPYSNGSVEVVLEAGLEVSFIVENENSVRVRFYNGSEYILIAARVTVSQAVEFVPTRECNTFATYISATLGEKKAVTSEERAFQTTTEVGSHLSNWNVPVTNQAIRVLMVPTFTGRLRPPLPPYSSSSPMTNSRNTPDWSMLRPMTPAITTSKASTKRRPTLLFAGSQIVRWDEFTPVETKAPSLSI